MSSDKDFCSDTPNDTNLVRPKVDFLTLLKFAGATKEIFTLKEVMFHLGQYIMQKQLYDQSQQHIVHCAQDPLGRILGVDSFSVKEPRALFAMLTKNLIAVKSHESSDGQSSSEAQKPTEGETEGSSPDRNRRRRRMRRRQTSGDPGPSQSTETADAEDESEGEEDTKKRRRSDSYSLTFDESLSWCVIGGLGGGLDRHGSRSSESHSTSEISEVTIPDSDSDSNDNFSVEFEVESVDSDDYDEDDDSLSGDDQIYEVTIIEAEGEDSFDEDTEIGEADYWKCATCEEFNPPLPRRCQRCWTLRQHWLPEVNVKPDSCPKLLPLKPKESEAKENPGSDGEENEGVDVPDGKRAKTPLPSQSLEVSVLESSCSAPNSQELSCSLSSSLPTSSSCSQEKLWIDSQPSSSDSQESLLCSPSVTSAVTVGVSSNSPAAGLASGPAEEPSAVPELERNVSAEWRLPDSCLDPCLICQSRPKNGCIVHGRTGHLMSCYVCARKLKKRNKLCPVCRMPIQCVILTYLS